MRVNLNTKIKPGVLSLVAVIVLHTLMLPQSLSATTIDSHYGGTFDIDPANFRIFDIPNDRFESVTGLPLSIQAPLGSLSQLKTKAPQATGKVLTILIEWVNHESNGNLAGDFDQLLYSDDLHPTGSVKDYYQEVSYGSFNITGQVVGWLTMTGSYSPNYSISAIINKADPFVNFANYDGDGDGKVDALWIVHSGPGQEETHDVNDIWSHAVNGANVMTNDGVRVERWSVEPELHAGGSMISARVFCHEYGHTLGLPDLYDYDGKIDTVTYFTPNDANDHPMQDWDVMGYYGYNIMSYGNRDCPSHFCAWSRTELGWTTPVVPPCLNGEYQLYNIEEHSTQNVLKVPISADGSEYFLLEYRNTRSSAQFDHLDADYSRYCPWFTPGRDSLDNGLLITHIDEAVYPNDGTPNWPNYGVAVVDAGYDPAHPWDGTEFTEWWYPYEFQIGALFSLDDAGQTQLTPTTVPNSNGYDGPSGITVAVTAQNPDYLTLTINRPLAPEIQPIAPVSIAADDSTDIGVIAIDPNCTDPTLASGSLPAFISFVDSSGGHGGLVLQPSPADVGVWYVQVLANDGGLGDTATVQITVLPPACDCHCHADADCDGFQSVVDVVAVIGRAFRSTNPTVDASCPPHGSSVDGRTDVDCSGGTDVVDVVKMIDVAFRGVAPSARICNPCL